MDAISEKERATNVAFSSSALRLVFGPREFGPVIVRILMADV